MYTIILFLTIASIVLITSNWKISTDKKEFQLDRSYTNVLRGVAMLFIMFGHVGGEYGESVWFSPLPGVGVALFLFLSGYGNNESYLKNKEWKARKLLRIALPYWLIAIPLYFVVGVNDWFNCILNLSFMRINSVYWFVGYIMQWYVVYWLSINYAYRYRWIIFAIFSAFSMVFLPALQIEQAFSFPCGVLISEHKTKLSLGSSKLYIVVACLLFFLATIALSAKQTSFIRTHFVYAPYLDFFIKLPYALFFIIVLRPLAFLSNHKLLAFIGGITYELYLVHMQCLRLIDTSTHIKTALTTVIFFLFSFMAAWILAKINKKLLKAIGL